MEKSLEAQLRDGIQAAIDATWVAESALNVLMVGYNEHPPDCQGRLLIHCLREARHGLNEAQVNTYEVSDADIS